MEIIVGTAGLLFALLVLVPALSGALSAVNRVREAGIEPPVALELGCYMWLMWLAFLLAVLLTASIILLIGPWKVSLFFQNIF